MKRIRSRTAEKNGDIVFPIISLCFFSDVQGQLTPRSVVQSGRNSNWSELSCMSSLPASIKTAGKKWRHCFFHHNPKCYHGNQWLDLAEIQTHPSSHLCYHYRSRKAKKKCRHRFSNNKPMGFFQSIKVS